ncbi:MAG: hypothetical protein ACC642_11790, partial [Pseudomonadales bacterium]
QAPPEALDESIQAAARKAIEPWYRNRRRLTSLATAASVVVAALVVYLDPGVNKPVEFTPPLKQIRMVDEPEVQTAGKRSVESISEAELRVAAPMDSVAEAVADRPVVRRLPAEALNAPPRQGLDSADGAEEATSDLASFSSKLEIDNAAAGAINASIDCGIPPGTEETRSYETYAGDDYLLVKVDAGTQYWRCDGTQWMEVDAPFGPELESDQQQPDP